MISSLTAWDEEKFQEYISKANHYGQCVTPCGLKNNSEFDTLNRHTYVESYYSLPGLPINDRYANSRNEYDYGDNKCNCPNPIYNDGDNIYQYEISSNHTVNYTNHNDIIKKPCFYDASKLNSCSRINNYECLDKNSINNKSYIQSIKDSNCSLDYKDNNVNNNTFNKYVQTITNEDEIKSYDRSIQTNIKTRNAGICTDISLMKIWLDEYLKKEYGQNQCNNTINTKKKENEKKKNNCTENIKKNQNHNKNFKVGQTINIQANVDTICNKSINKNNENKKIKFDDIDNKSIIDTNLDEITIMSKGNSKLNSFNDILENFGLKPTQVDNNENKKMVPTRTNALFSSFWDNPLDINSNFYNTKTKINKKTKINIINNESNNTNGGLLRKSNITLSNGDYIGGNEELEVNKILNQITIECESSKNETEKNNIKNNSSNSTKSLNNPNLLNKTFHRQGNLRSGNGIVLFENNGYNCIKSTNTPPNRSPPSCTGDGNMKYYKIFFLNPYDDLIKSHLSSCDRRLKSVSAKNHSDILIEGPISSNEVVNKSNTLSKSSLLYRCTIKSSCQENLDKCINYLKETFPQSYLKSKGKKL